MINRKKTLHKTGSSAVTDILKGKGKKKEKRKKKEIITTRGIHIWSPNQAGTSSNRALLSGRDAALSLWYHDSTLDNFIIIILLLLLLLLLSLLLLLLLSLLLLRFFKR